jgi:hypothetical protein
VRPESGMGPEDHQEIEWRLEEVMFIAERGYEPVFDVTLGEPLWIKCHWGSVHTHAGALEEIARDERRTE